MLRDLPVSALLQEEKRLQTTLTLARVRLEKLVQDFQKRHLEIDGEIFEASERLKILRRQIALHSVVDDIAVICPDHRRLAENPQKIESISPQLFEDALDVKCLPANTLDVDRRHPFAEPLLSFSEYSWVPCLSEGTLVRMLPTATVSIMKDRQKGRVLVSRRDVQEGETIFFDEPFLLVPEEFDILFLPPILKQCWERVHLHSDLMTQRMWPPNALIFIFSYLQEALRGETNASRLRECMGFLNAPLETIPPDHLKNFADFSKFIFSALAVDRVNDLVGLKNSDDVLVLLQAAQCNALSVFSPLLSSPPPFVTETARALCGLLSLCEHNCDPSASVTFRRYEGKRCHLVAQLKAERPIQNGDRISISYVPPSLPRVQRRARLKTQYYFHCDCTRCSSGLDWTTCIQVQNDDRHLYVQIGEGRKWEVRLKSDGAAVSSPMTTLDLEEVVRQNSIKPITVGCVNEKAISAIIALVQSESPDVPRIVLILNELAHFFMEDPTFILKIVSQIPQCGGLPIDIFGGTTLKIRPHLKLYLSTFIAVLELCATKFPILWVALFFLLKYPAHQAHSERCFAAQSLAKQFLLGSPLQFP